MAPITNMNKGFTLFIAIVTTSALALISAGLINLVVKQLLISNVSRESQQAFYAADTGLDCALFWDLNNPAGWSAFATSSPPTDIVCNGEALGTFGGTAATAYTFSMNLDSHCATVTVSKGWSTILGRATTTVESRGYNTCDTTNARRVERAIRANY